MKDNQIAGVSIWQMETMYVSIHKCMYVQLYPVIEWEENGSI